MEDGKCLLLRMNFSQYGRSRREEALICVNSRLKFEPPHVGSYNEADFPNALYALSASRPVCQTDLRMADTLLINEIYLSLQGESTFAGLPCIFVRLTACNLRCSYCDSAYAFTEGQKRTLDEIREEIHRLAAPFSLAECRGASVEGRHGRPGLPLIELTGGEPLLQKNSLPLMRELCDEGFTVLLE